MDGSQWSVAGIASRNPIGVLAVNGWLDCSLVVLGDLFPAIDRHGEVLGDEDAIASPVMLRGRMDCL